jgi:hypothetical protein
MAVATTIANQLRTARRDAVDKLEASKAVYLLEPTNAEENVASLLQC